MKRLTKPSSSDHVTIRTILTGASASRLISSAFEPAAEAMFWPPGPYAVGSRNGLVGSRNGSIGSWNGFRRDMVGEGYGGERPRSSERERSRKVNRTKLNERDVHQSGKWGMNYVAGRETMIETISK
jgi:hypothetical protein